MPRGSGPRKAPRKTQVGTRPATGKARACRPAPRGTSEERLV
jgi:hypothetical protein